MQPLNESTYYHIYKHGNGNDNLFREAKNYSFFLEKYREYISPAVDTLAYCLMPNHFHLLIKVKSLDEIKAFRGGSLNLPHPKLKTLDEVNTLNALNTKNATLKKLQALDIYDPLHVSRLFSNFFSSYTQAFNKVYKRRGNLFIKNFKRNLIDSDEYLRNVVNYIHFNPVHHGFVSHPTEWEHSSYLEIVSQSETFINIEELLHYFDSIENFLYCHQTGFEPQRFAYD